MVKDHEDILAQHRGSQQFLSVYFAKGVPEKVKQYMDDIRKYVADAHKAKNKEGNH